MSTADPTKKKNSGELECSEKVSSPVSYKTPTMYLIYSKSLVCERGEKKIHIKRKRSIAI